MGTVENVSGGYFIVRPAARPEYSCAELLPAQLLSASDCICSIAPSWWSLEWSQTAPVEREQTAAEFGIRPQVIPDVFGWFNERFESGRVGYPGILYELSDARKFLERFVKAPDAAIVGIGLPHDLVAQFITKVAPVDDCGPPGVYVALTKDTPLEPGADLGHEVLGFDSGDFHSWLCNGLEKDVAKALGIRPNQNGLISSPADARLVAEYCGRDDVGAEPCTWMEWLLMRYDV